MNEYRVYLIQKAFASVVVQAENENEAADRALDEAGSCDWADGQTEVDAVDLQRRGVEAEWVTS